MGSNFKNGELVAFVLILVYHFVNYVEITAFSDRHAEFDKINTEILGVSIDSVVCFPCSFSPFVFL